MLVLVVEDEAGVAHVRVLHDRLRLVVEDAVELLGAEVGRAPMEHDARPVVERASQLVVEALAHQAHRTRTVCRQN